MIIIIKTGYSHVSPTCPGFKFLRTNFFRGFVPASMFHYLPLDTVRKMRKVPAAPTKRQTYASQKLRDEATAQRAKAKKARLSGLWRGAADKT